MWFIPDLIDLKEKFSKFELAAFLRDMFKSDLLPQQLHNRETEQYQHVGGVVIIDGMAVVQSDGKDNMGLHWAELTDLFFQIIEKRSKECNEVYYFLTLCDSKFSQSGNPPDSTRLQPVYCVPFLR